MTWGIIGALDAEVAMIKDAMVLEDTREVYGSTFYVGTIHGQRVTAVCCSVGTINAAACACVMIREFGAEAVVNVGIAGNADPELNILDVVLSDDLVFHDADLDILEQYYPFRRSFPADPALRALAVRAIDSLPDRKFKWKVGRIASGDAYVTDSGLRGSIISRCQPTCIEMEGAAIAQVAYMSGVPFLVIRTMSDNADESTPTTYDNFLELAAQNSAQILLEMLWLSQHA